MIKKLKILGPILLVIILVVIIIGYGQIKNKNQNKVAGEVTTVGQKVNVSLKLTYPGGETKDYSATLSPEEATAFGVLKNLNEKEKLGLDFENGSYGVFVKSIGGVANTKTEFWSYSVNGKAGEVASDQSKLNQGDLVTWEFIKF